MLETTWKEKIESDTYITERFGTFGFTKPFGKYVFPSVTYEPKNILWEHKGLCVVSVSSQKFPSKVDILLLTFTNKNSGTMNVLMSKRMYSNKKLVETSKKFVEFAMLFHALHDKGWVIKSKIKQSLMRDFDVLTSIINPHTQKTEKCFVTCNMDSFGIFFVETKMNYLYEKLQTFNRLPFEPTQKEIEELPEKQTIPEVKMILSSFSNQLITNNEIYNQLGEGRPIETIVEKELLKEQTRANQFICQNSRNSLNS